MCSKMRLVDRDIRLFREIDRWRVVSGAQLKELCEFPSLRTCDRRLKKLIEAKYIIRKKILYGMPYLYFLTSNAQVFIHVPKSTPKIKIEQIVHDFAVVDTAIYFYRQGIKYTEMITETQMHRKDGFTERKHRPDFIYQKENIKVCVEVELSQKSKTKFEANVEENFMNYDKQVWVVPDLHCKISKRLQESQAKYNNIEIITLDKVRCKND